MEAFLSVIVAAMGVFLIGRGTAPDFEDFTQRHNKTPYCITREIGPETIKKCYVATEVKE